MNNFRAERMVVSTSVHFKKYWSYSALFWCCCCCSLVVLDNCETGSCTFYSNVRSKTSSFTGKIDRTMQSLTFRHKILLQECYWFFFSFPEWMASPQLWPSAARRLYCGFEDGRRENVVQLRTLKRTRLASREHVGWKHRQLGYTERKKNHFSLSNSTIAPNEFPVDNFECAHSPPAMVSTLYRKNKQNWNFT